MGESSEWKPPGPPASLSVQLGNEQRPARSFTLLRDVMPRQCTKAANYFPQSFGVPALQHCTLPVFLCPADQARRLRFPYRVACDEAEAPGGHDGHTSSLKLFWVAQEMKELL